LGELLREEACLAVRNVFEAEVLVELKESLVLPGKFEMRAGPGE
jgi:hypothetical protein